MSSRSRCKRLSGTKPHGNPSRLVRRSLRTRKPTSAWYAAPPPPADIPASDRDPVRGLIFRQDHDDVHFNRPSPFNPPSPETNRRASVDIVPTRLFHHSPDNDTVALHDSDPVLGVSSNHGDNNLKPVAFPGCSLTHLSKSRTSQSPVQSQAQPRTSPSPESHKEMSHLNDNDAHPLSPPLQTSVDQAYPSRDDESKQFGLGTSSTFTPNLTDPSILNSEPQHGQSEENVVLPLPHQTQIHGQDSEGSDSRLFRTQHNQSVNPNRSSSVSPDHLAEHPHGNNHVVGPHELQTLQYQQTPPLFARKQSLVPRAMVSLNKAESEGQGIHPDCTSTPVENDSVIHADTHTLPPNGSRPYSSIFSNAVDGSTDFGRCSQKYELGASISVQNVSSNQGNHSEIDCRKESPRDQLLSSFSPDHSVSLSPSVSTQEQEPDVAGKDMFGKENKENIASNDTDLNDEQDDIHQCDTKEHIRSCTGQPSHRFSALCEKSSNGSSPPSRSPLQTIDPNEQHSPSLWAPTFSPQAPRKKIEVRPSTPCAKLGTVSQGKNVIFETNIDSADSPLATINGQPANKKRPRLADAASTPSPNTENRNAFSQNDRNNLFDDTDMKCSEDVSVTQGRFWLTRSTEVRRMLQQDLRFHNMLSFVITLNIHHTMFVAEVILSSRGSTGARCVLAGHTEIFVVGALFAGILECTIHTTQLRLRRGDHLAISSGQTYRLDNTSISDCPLLYIEAALS